MLFNVKRRVQHLIYLNACKQNALYKHLLDLFECRKTMQMIVFKNLNSFMKCLNLKIGKNNFLWKYLKHIPYVKGNSNTHLCRL